MKGVNGTALQSLPHLSGQHLLVRAPPALLLRCCPRPLLLCRLDCLHELDEGEEGRGGQRQGTEGGRPGRKRRQKPAATEREVGWQWQ